jgi:hypothetical protein
MPEEGESRSRQDGLRKWQWMILGSALTIVAGFVQALLVHWFIGTPPPQAGPSPLLAYYSVPPSPASAEGEREATPYVVKFWNAGNKEAEDVRVAIAFPSASKLRKGQIEPSEGAAADYSLKKQANGWLVEFPTLVPHESCTARLWLEPVGTGQLHVSVRSKTVLGLATPSPVTGVSARFQEGPPLNEHYPALAVLILLAIVWLLLENKRHHGRH